MCPVFSDIAHGEHAVSNDLDQATETVNRMIEVVQNAQRIEAVDELFASDFVNHSAPPGYPSDREGMRRLFSATHRGFPDGKIEVLDQISNGSRVWTHKAFTGTHTGNFAGAEATGRMVTYEVIDILKVADGRIVAHWSAIDRLSLFQQLGLLGQGT